MKPICYAMCFKHLHFKNVMCILNRFLNKLRLKEVVPLFVPPLFPGLIGFMETRPMKPMKEMKLQSAVVCCQSVIWKRKLDFYGSVRDFMSTV